MEGAGRRVNKGQNKQEKKNKKKEHHEEGRGGGEGERGNECGRRGRVVGSFPVLQLQLCFCCIIEILTKKTVFLVYIIYFIKGVITYISTEYPPFPPSHTYVHPTPMGMFLLLLPIFFKTTLILSDQNMN